MILLLSRFYPKSKEIKRNQKGNQKGNQIGRLYRLTNLLINTDPIGRSAEDLEKLAGFILIRN